MKLTPNIRLIYLTIALVVFASCQTIKKVNVPIPKPGEEEILSCDKLKPEHEFNGLRLKAFQELVTSLNQRLKSLPTTPLTTEKIAFVERMRRRITWPMISVKLRPTLMTETINQEMDTLTEFFRARPPVSKEDEAFLAKMNLEIRLKLEDTEAWLCPVKVEIPKTPPPIPPQLQEKDPSGEQQTIIFDN